VNLLEALLGKGCVKTSVFDTYGASPLLLALMCSNIAATKLLLRAGADVNLVAEPSGQVCTPLVAAIMENNGEMVELLLKAGAIPSSYALQKAGSARNVPILKALVDSGARLDHRFKDAWPPAMTILHTAEGYEAKKWILERAPDLIDAVSRDGLTALDFLYRDPRGRPLWEETSYHFDQLPEAVLLVQKGCPVRSPYAFSVESALHRVASLGHLPVIKAILKRDPSLIGIKDQYGNTPLHHATTCCSEGGTQLHKIPRPFWIRYSCKKRRGAITHWIYVWKSSASRQIPGL
jgi:ankyrin repeat protein